MNTRSSANAATGKPCQPEHLAIVGTGMRLPGQIRTIEALWSLLIDKKSTRGKVPEDRFNVDAFYSDSGRSGAMKTKFGHFLTEPSCLKHLDTHMFPMMQKELEVLDPQERLLLEVIYECMQNAGQTDWRGQVIGCFVGVFGEDWSDLYAKDTQAGGIPGPHRICGQHDFALANRVSYEFDFKGPSCTVKSACSSSLMALHSAARAITAGDCKSAIVAGTSLIFTPTATASMWPALSPEGKCKSFDVAADGYARGEAINAILVKPLADAIQNRDAIRAVIRGTAVNFDGRTSNLTIPNPVSQELLMRNCYAEAGLDPRETPFIEAHGTGTPVGDPIEAKAIARVFANQSTKLIGSVKPNLGHAEGASGLSSVIKCIAALEQGAIPPNIFFDKANPNIDFAAHNLAVPAETCSWPENMPERASVNSFGIAGANAHVILESLKSFDRSSGTDSKLDDGSPRQALSKPTLLVLSAQSEQSLARSIVEHQKYAESSLVDLHDLAYTLCNRREHLQFRSFCVTDGASFTFTPSQARSRQMQVIMVFAGQGSQWTGSAKELLDSSPEFADEIDTLSGFLSRAEHPPQWTIRQKIAELDILSSSNDPCHAQPVMTAVQIATVNLLSRRGVHAASVIGHSSGEVAAAYVAGAITAEAAMLISYYRGQSASQISQRGSMVAVGLSTTQTQPLLEKGTVIACENSNHNVTLSGDSESMVTSCQRIKNLFPDVFMRALNVEVAYHSPHMKEVADGYESILRTFVNCTAPSIPMFSSVTGDAVQNHIELDPAYWRMNMESPVLFNTAMSKLIRDSESHHVFIEIGPHAALSAPIRQILGSLNRSQDMYRSVWQRNHDSDKAMLNLIGDLHCCGVPIDLGVLVPEGKLLTNLPLYQWTHDKEHWSESNVTRQWRFSKFPHHELLGSRTIESNDLQPEWRNVLYIRDLAWLQDHRIQNEIVFPFTGYIAMATEALRRITSATDYLIHCITILRPLLLTDSDSLELVTSFRPVRLTLTSKSPRWEFAIMTRDEQAWSEVCHGEIEAGKLKSLAEPKTQRQVRSVLNHYFGFQKLGLQYGPAFRLLTDVTVAPTNMIACASILPPPVSHSSYAVHPTVIDSCLQLNGVAMCQGLFRRATRLHLPVSLEGLYLSEHAMSDEPIMAEAIGVEKSSGRFAGQIWGVSQDKIFLHCQKAIFQSLPGELADDEDDTVAGAKLVWRPDVDLLNMTCTTPRGFVKLLGHSNPTLTILHVHPDGFGDIAPEDILGNLVTKAGYTQYATYKYACTSQSATEKAQLQLETYNNVSFQQLESRHAPVASEHDDEAFDLIVVAWEYLRAHWRELRRLLHPQGWLMISDCRNEAYCLNEILGNAGFSTAQRLVCEEDDTLPTGEGNKSILVTRPAYQLCPLERLTLVVPAKRLSAFSSKVKHYLEHQGVSVDVRELHEDIIASQDVLFLLDVDTPFFDHISSCDFVAFQKLMQRVSSSTILWVMRPAQKMCTDPRFGLSLGLLRTIRQELSISIATLEIDCLEDASLPGLERIMEKLRRRKMDDLIDPDYEFVLESGVARVGRFHPISVQKELEASTEHTLESKLEVGQTGLLESLRWVHCDVGAPENTEVVVRIRAVGVNFKDILVSMGVLEHLPLGVEGAGVVESVGREVTGFQKGDRVLVLGAGCFATCVKLPATSCTMMPFDLSFEEAATIPCVYATAIHCLMDMGGLQKGDSVLIHSACGGVGLAAIQICQRVVGAEIYATVGSDEKAQHLVDTYGIPRDQIFDSRTSDFHEQIMKATRGRGVDLVLNSLSGELLHMSWKCVAEFGRMVEIGKRDFIGRARLDMASFGGNRSFIGVDLASLPPSKLRKLVDRLLDFLDQGHVIPITPMKVFPAGRIEETFRHMQSGSRMGKVIVSLPEAPSEQSAMPVAPETQFDPNATYVLVGGLGALGRATSTWMVERGARYFIYVSRTAGKSDKDGGFLGELASQGCSALAIAGNVADVGVVQKIVTMALRPIKGVFQLSMALPNLAFLDMSHSDWEEGLVAKVDGTWNLHHELPKNLDFFILASSIGGCFGHIGQANYAAANTFLDAFVHYRHRHGLTASVVDIGLIGDMGYIMEHPSVLEKFRAAGSYFVGENECIKSFQWAILNGSPRLPSEISHGRISIGIRTLKPLSSPDNHLPWVRDRRMALYRNLTVEVTDPRELHSNDKLKNLIARVKTDVKILDSRAAQDLITREIGARIYAALMKPVEDLSFDQKLEDIGVDSLVLMEMRNWSKRNFGGAEISTLDFLNAGTIGDLGVLAINALRRKYLPKVPIEEDALTHAIPNEDSIVQKSLQPEARVDLALETTNPSTEGSTSHRSHSWETLPPTENSIPSWVPPVFMSSA